MDATTVAVDLAKTVFEVAIANRSGISWLVIDSTGAVHAFPRRDVADPRRDGSVWHRPLLGAGRAEHGHRVTLLPPGYVRPYVRRNKTDRTDAEALLEATRSGQIPPCR